MFFYTEGDEEPLSKNENVMTTKKYGGDEPKGIIIALVVNMQSIGLTKTAEKLVQILKDQ